MDADTALIPRAELLKQFRISDASERARTPKPTSPDFSCGFVGGWVLIRESACPAVQDRLV